MAVSVTILIVTFNSRRFYPRLKAALEAQTFPFELIVVDNASRLEDRPTAEDFPAGALILQQDANLGFAAGNNVAARAAQTDYIALLNPDAFPAPDWLERLLEATTRYPADTLFGSTQLLDADPSRLDGEGDVMHAIGFPYRGGHRRPIETAQPEERETFSACAAAMLIRREVFLGLGGFDEDYFCYVEDVDFGFRLRLAGGRSVQVPGAVVRHVSGGSSSAHSGFADFHGARNRIWTFVRCMPGPLFWLLAPVHAAATLALLAVHTMQGRRGSWRGAAAGLQGLPLAFRKRRAAQQARRASLVEIARALAWSPLVLIGRRPVLRRLAASDRPD